MILPFKSVFVLSIAILLYMPLLLLCKSVAMTTKKEPSTRRSNGYVETCFDVEPKRCSNFDFYCLTRAEYMSDNCKLTCKMCKPGDPVIDLSSKCAVELDKRQETLCVQQEWIRVCPYSCREYICADKVQDCVALASKGGCLSQHQYMTDNCMLTCAVCSPGDPVMDKTSECKPKQALCSTDMEWKQICPHTCRNYLPSPPQGTTYQPGVTTNQQVSTPVVQPQPQPGNVVQPGQPQQPVGQLPPQQPLQPQPATTQTRLQQMVQPQPQVQQPGQSQVNSALQPALVQPQMQQTTSPVGSVMQPSNIQQPAPQVSPPVQTAPMQPPMQQTMTQPQPQPLPVQQQVQQPYPQPQTSQPLYQPQTNAGQTYQPVMQQPQPGTVQGPMKKQKGLKKEISAKGSPTEEKTSKTEKTHMKEEKEATPTEEKTSQTEKTHMKEENEATPTEEKTSQAEKSSNKEQNKATPTEVNTSKTEITDQEEENKKDDSQKIRGSKARDKNDKKKRKKEETKFTLPVMDNSESAAKTKLLNMNKTIRS